MRPSLASAYLVMIVVQVVHAMEEFLFHFWDVFPPMRVVYGGTPGLGERVFIAFHALLIGIGLWSYRRWVRGGGASARTVVRWGIFVQSFTVLLHAAWFLTELRYQPGLATTTLFVPAIALAIVALKHA
jgi:hypothetical protein